MHPGFQAKYSGANSLADTLESKLSITSTIFAGAGLWKGGAVYINPELSGGQGLSSTTGIAGFPNGEIYRVGVAAPVVNLSRLYLQQVINLGGTDDLIPDGPNQVLTHSSTSRLTLSLGKFSIVDFFDDNTYSHDPRSQFLNWAMMDNGAWDYPADTRGYTEGFVAEFKHEDWSVRIAEVAVPTTANGGVLEYRPTGGAHAEAIELEKHYLVGGEEGVARAIYYHNVARMGSYRETLNTPSDSMSITKSDQYGRVKYGFGIDLEQKLSSLAGVFLRAGWNDGATETWAFTEIDRTVSGGVLFTGAGWSRPQDNLGVGFVVNGLSDDHKDYLAAGGYGFIIGDGALNYAPEEIGEAYYRIAFTENIAITGDLQGVMHPAYNADRGPVVIYSIRTHLEF
jgi:high affinity Mn2+ porin